MVVINRIGRINITDLLQQHAMCLELTSHGCLDETGNETDYERSVVEPRLTSPRVVTSPTVVSRSVGEGWDPRRSVSR